MREVTTIKVPKVLRQRLIEAARAEGTTVARLLQTMLEDREREQRFAAVDRAYRALGEDDDDGYAQESAQWQGLEDEVPWPR